MAGALEAAEKPTLERVLANTGCSWPDLERM